MSSDTVNDDHDRLSESSADQFVGFRIDHQEFAIPIGKVQEIVVLEKVTKIPQVEAYVEGVSNLRGTIIPIVNLRRLFGKDATPMDNNARTIVVNVDDKTIGCVVDSVTQVLTIRRGDVQPAPDMVSSEANRFLAGFAKLDDRVIVLLNSDDLLDPDKLESVHQSGLLQLPSSP